MWKRLIVIILLLGVIAGMVVYVNFNNNLLSFKTELIQGLDFGDFELLEKKIINGSLTSSIITYKIFIDKPQDEDTLKNITRQCILESLNGASLFNKVGQIGIEFVIRTNTGNQTYRYYSWKPESHEKAYSYKDYILLEIVTASKIDF